MRVSSSVLYLRSTRKEEKQNAPRGEPDLTNLRIVKEKKRDKETPLGQQVACGFEGWQIHMAFPRIGSSRIGRCIASYR